MQTVVTTKGQIVIPADLRKKYGIKKGTRIHVFDVHGQIVLQPVTPQYVRSLRGILRGSKALEVLSAERTWERDREDARRRSCI